MIYTPHNLEVIEKKNLQEYLEKIYNNDASVVGKGFNGFYKNVCLHYINITREEVKQFLTKQPNYQILHKTTNRINKPIIALYPQQLWACDLIDMGVNHISKGKRYILTMADIYSRKAFLRSLTQKESENVTAAFQNILTTAKLLPAVFPSWLISDNGSEFRGALSVFCKNHNIKQRFTKSYSPQSNGIIENLNGKIRVILRGLMLKENTPLWSDLLSTCEKALNTSYTSAISTMPDRMWSPTKNKIAMPKRLLPETIPGNVQSNLIRGNILKTQAKIAKFKSKDLEIGDMIRIKMDSLYNNQKRAIKAGDKKNLVIRYSPEIFRVKSILANNSPLLERKRYTCEDLSGRTLKRQNAVVFYGSELLKVHHTTTPQHYISMDRALKLNKIEPNENDVILYGDGLYFNKIATI